MNNSMAFDTPSGPGTFNGSSNKAAFAGADDQVDRVNAIFMPIFCAIAMIIIYLPARDFYAKRNFACCSMILSIQLLNLYQFLNAIIWNTEDTTNWFSGVGLCDIQVNSRYMLTTAYMTSLFCFVKNLGDVFYAEGVYLTKGMKRKRLITDILIVWLLPVLQVAYHYPVVVGRFSIFPVYGCLDEYDGSWPYIVGYVMWFPIFTFLILVYSIRLLMGLSKYRKTIGNTLSTSGSGMTSKYYVKLTIIALSIVIVWVPVQIFYTYLNIPREFHSYNYAEIHRPEDWNPIVYLPLSLDGQVQYNGWAAIAVAFLIFVYFGFNDEAVDTYRSWLVKLGMAKFWPSLKEPRLPQHSRRGSNSTGQSFTGRFDLVSKAMKYFDGGLKGSQDSTSNNGSAATRIAPKGSRGTMRTYSSGTMTDRTASTPSPQMLLVPQINSPHLYPTPGQFAPPAKRSFFSTFRTHVNIPIIHHKNQEASLRDDLKPCTRICKVCGRGCNFQDIEGQTQPWAPGSGCTGPNGVHALSTNIWSEANPNPKPPSIIDEKYEEDEVKMGTKAYRQRETAEYQEKQNVEMSGAVVVEKTMERTESNVRGGGV